MTSVRTMRIFHRLLAGVVCLWPIAQATAQGFPTKPVTVIVPYPAGGPSDFVARRIQPELARLLGQPIIVENVGGVGGALGVQRVLNAPADGHNMVIGTPMELVLAPLGMAAVKHKPEDLKAVGQIANATMALVSRRDLAANNVDELVALAKRPGKGLSYGSVGPGSLYHLVAEKFSQLIGATMLHVPYKGAAPLMNDLLGGQIDLVFIPLAGSTGGMIQEGKVRGYGITAPTPHPQHPNLSALAAQKGLEGMDFSLWIGYQVPRSTPEDVSARLNRAINEALQNADVRKALENTGNVMAPAMNLGELATLYAAEIERYRAIAKTINLQPQ